jgi:hypothetical protein
MKFRVLWELALLVTLKLADVSEMRTTSIIALMMEAVRIPETSVKLNVFTQRYIPEDSKLGPNTCVVKVVFYI